MRTLNHFQAKIIGRKIIVHTTLFFGHVTLNRASIFFGLSTLTLPHNLDSIIPVKPYHQNCTLWIFLLHYKAHMKSFIFTLASHYIYICSLWHFSRIIVISNNKHAFCGLEILYAMVAHGLHQWSFCFCRIQRVWNSRRKNTCLH